MPFPHHIKVSNSLTFFPRNKRLFHYQRSLKIATIDICYYSHFKQSNSTALKIYLRVFLPSGYYSLHNDLICFIQLMETYFFGNSPIEQRNYLASYLNFLSLINHFRPLMNLIIPIKHDSFKFALIREYLSILRFDQT